MGEYIVKTSDNRNISYMDDDPESVRRRAEFAGFVVTSIITCGEYEREIEALYGQEELNHEIVQAIEGGNHAA